ncbi:HAD family phosphatase [uncultured Ruminococcus sp.]|uniref:HAD family hydrolase n=1 Tax=uncultured Ruminococcus sp. TaxID=165186 RepID=UPI002666596D|nr:HAD family phosphatase [uncultured Ruminococcus sp.]
MDIKDFKGHIFDLDGTLTKSNHVWSKIDEDFLGKRGIEVPEDYFKQVSAMNFEQAAVYTNDRFSLGENIQDIMKEWFDMAVYEYTNVIGLCGNAGEYVRRLKDQGRKIALATASTEELYRPVLKRNGILDCFDCFVSTEQVKRGKGFPDVYELAAEKLGLEARDCVVYEDIVEGIKGAKAGGFFAVACLNDHYSHDWDEMRDIADEIVEGGEFPVK